MATCAAIVLNFEDTPDELQDSYCFKLCLSEGISRPPLAKLTIITQSELTTSQLKKILGHLVRIQIIQAAPDFSSSQLASPQYSAAQFSSLQDSVFATTEKTSSRFVQGKVLKVVFVQKVTRHITVNDEVQKQNSFVYELFITSALHALTLSTHSQLINQSPQGVKDLIAHYFQDGQHEIEFTPPTLDSFINFESLLHQENESAYALLVRYLYLKGWNYVLAHGAHDFKELLVLGDELQSPNPLLYDAELKPCAIPHSYDLEQDHTLLQDFNYRCEGQCPIEFEFLLKDQSTAKAEIPEDEIQALAADPFLRFISPNNFSHNDKQQSYKALYRQLRLTKLRQLQNESECITATTSNLVFQPGYAFELKKTSETLPLMVVSSQLMAVAPFPTDRAYPAPTCAEKILTQSLVLLNQSSFTAGIGCLLATHDIIHPECAFDFARLALIEQQLTASHAAQMAASSSGLSSLSANASSNSALSTGQSALTSQLSAGAASSYTSTLSSQVPALGGQANLGSQVNTAMLDAALRFLPRFATAVVCKENGKVDDDVNQVYLVLHDNVACPSLVYACLDETKEIVVVEQCNDLEYFPRLGDHIKVMLLHGRCLYIGRISSGAYNQAFSNQERRNELYSRRFINTSPDKALIKQSFAKKGTASQLDNSKVKTPPSDEKAPPAPTPSTAMLGLDYVDSVIDLVVYHCQNGTLNHFAFGQAVSRNSASIWSQYNEAEPDLLKAYKDMLKAQADYEKANTAYFEELFKAVDSSSGSANSANSANDINAAHSANSANGVNSAQSYNSAHGANSAQNNNSTNVANSAQNNNSGNGTNSAQSDATSVSTKDLEKKSDDFVNAYNLFYLHAAKIAHILQLQPLKGTMLANLHNDSGNVLVGSADGNVELLGAQINTAGDAINLTGKTIKISADDELVLAVGGNAISIDRNGICIESRKWTGVCGMWDAAILLDSMSGISISGMSTDVSGVLGVKLSDPFGSEIEIGGGTIKQSALSSQISSSAGPKDMKLLNEFIISVTNEFISMGKTVSSHDTTYGNAAQNHIYYATNDVFELTDILFCKTKDLISKHKAAHSVSNKAYKTIVLDFAKQLMQIIITMANFTEHFLLCWFPDKLNYVLNSNAPNFTVRDLLRLFSFSYKFLALVAIFPELYATMATTASSSINFAPSELFLDAKDIFVTCQQKVDANHVAAGLIEPDDATTEFQVTPNTMSYAAVGSLAFGAAIMDVRDNNQNDQKQAERQSALDSINKDIADLSPKT